MNNKCYVHTNKTIAFYSCVYYNMFPLTLGEIMKHELNPHEPVDVHGITLGNSYWEFAKFLGRGNASKGIRRALYEVSLSNGNKPTRENDSGEANKMGVF